MSLSASVKVGLNGYLPVTAGAGTGMDDDAGMGTVMGAAVSLCTLSLPKSL